ncbi:MAG TPA: hypothetical protein VFM32_08920 [Spongiibacteraceae bacterium]|nr:hypothetical protein [Spongiibacteraceae bacterium]
MKKHSFIALFITSALSTAAQADEVVAPAHDNIGGTLYGGMIGLMAGGATGGPIGALAGAGIGALAGHHVQDATGLSQRAYLIKTDNGDQVIVRSPNAEFAPGQMVVQDAGRIRLAN